MAKIRRRSRTRAAFRPPHKISRNRNGNEKRERTADPPFVRASLAALQHTEVAQRRVLLHALVRGAPSADRPQELADALVVGGPVG